MVLSSEAPLKGGAEELSLHFSDSTSDFETKERFVSYRNELPATFPALLAHAGASHLSL